MARYSSTVVVAFLLVCTLIPPQAKAQTCYALVGFFRIPVACPATAAPATAAPTAAPTTAAPTTAAAATGCPAGATLSWCPLYKVITNTCNSGNGVGLGLIGSLLAPGAALLGLLGAIPAAVVSGLASFLIGAGNALLALNAQGAPAAPVVTGWTTIGGALFGGK